MSQEFEDSIVWESTGKSFRLRIDADVRRSGISQIRGYEKYINIEFIGGYDVRIYYPSDMKRLFDAVDSKLRLETNLSQIRISNIAAFIHHHRDEIVEAVKEIMVLIN